MWNFPKQNRLNCIPRLCETDGVPLKDKLIYLHFFLNGYDWYVAEYDGDDLFFGYTTINRLTAFAEWGYFSFKKLKRLRVNGLRVTYEREENWRIRKASEVENIQT